MTNFDYCALVKKIHKNPLEKVDITIGEYLGLEQHYTECEACQKLIEETCEQYKDIGPGSSTWNQADLN